MIAKRIAEDQPTARKREILCSVPGLGPIAAALRFSPFCPKSAHWTESRSEASPASSPTAVKSGKWKGKSSIGGGRKPLRDAIYMPALVAMRFNPDLKAKYAELREAGKPAKVAIVAIMRKLLETAERARQS